MRGPTLVAGSLCRNLPESQGKPPAASGSVAHFLQPRDHAGGAGPRMDRIAARAQHAVAAPFGIESHIEVTGTARFFQARHHLAAIAQHQHDLAIRCRRRDCADPAERHAGPVAMAASRHQQWLGQGRWRRQVAAKAGGDANDQALLDPHLAPRFFRKAIGQGALPIAKIGGGLAHRAAGAIAQGLRCDGGRRGLNDRRSPSRRRHGHGIRPNGNAQKRRHGHERMDQTRHQQIGNEPTIPHVRGPAPPLAPDPNRLAPCLAADA